MTIQEPNFLKLSTLGTLSRPVVGSNANMPVPIINQVLTDGFNSLPFLLPVLKVVPWLVALYLLKTYFSGASNTSERNLHGKVALVTVHTNQLPF